MSILVLGGYALYTMSAGGTDAAEGASGRDGLAGAQDEAARRQAEPEPFRDALRERTPWPLVMPVLVAVNVLVFLAMGWGGERAGDARRRGARASARARPTANGGGSSRRCSCTPARSQLLVNGAALVQLGLILERLVGHVTFAAVYVAAGLLASIVSLSDYPMAVSSGASGAIFGLYGLLLASSAWTAVPARRRRAGRAASRPRDGTFGFRELSQAGPVTRPATGRNRAPSDTPPTGVVITMTAAKRLAPIAAIFLLYNLCRRQPGQRRRSSPGSPPASSAASR